MRVLIGCNVEKKGSLELAAEISALLKKNGFTPCVWGTSSSYSKELGSEMIETPGICTFILTVGGDGTILKWGKVAAQYDIPLLGVNMGRLGFMASLEPDDIGKIPELFRGDYATSTRMMLDCRLYHEGRCSYSERVLNDVILSRESRSKLPEYSVSCGGAEVSRVRADGIVLSTPTGSTAYSLSAGGPILAPDLECIELTALCPHTLFNRPMIFSDKQIISVRVHHYDNSEATFSVDGAKGIPILEGDVLRISRAKGSLQLIETGEGFYGSINRKLMTPMK